MFYVAIFAIFIKFPPPATAEPLPSTHNIQNLEDSIVHLIQAINCTSFCIDNKIGLAQSILTQSLVSIAINFSVEQYFPLIFGCLKLKAGFPPINKLQNSSLPKVLLNFEHNSSLTNITGSIGNQVFRITQDILLIISVNDYKNDPTRHKFDGQFPNFLPKTAILILKEVSGIFIFQPHQTRLVDNELETKWKKVSSIKKLRRLLAVGNRKLSKTNFERLPFLLTKIQIPKGGRFSCASKQPRAVSPWAVNIGLLILCDFITQFNVTVKVNTSYPWPPYTYTVLSKPFRASSLFLTVNNLNIAFSVPDDPDGINLQGILGPIGPDVLAWTSGSAIFVTIFIYISVRMFGNKLGKGNRPKEISVTSALEFVLRPILEQCQDRRGNDHDYFRVGFLPWLLFSIIIAEGYRGELVSFMIQPPSGWVPETFR